MVELKCIYTSACVNRTPHCLATASNGVILFGVNNAVAVAKIDAFENVKIEETLAQHSGRVNCVRWISKDVFVSASTDGTMCIWTRSEGKFSHSLCLKGHSDSVTSVDGFKLSNTSFLLASTSADNTIRVWTVEGSVIIQHQVIQIERRGFVLDLRLTSGIDGIVFLIASTDDCNVRIYSCKIASTFEFQLSFKLSGHEDWVQCLDIASIDDHSLMVATAGQDSYIRLWKISKMSKENALEELKSVKDLKEDEEIRQKEDFFSCGEIFFSVCLESILDGHEDKVYGLKWRKDSKTDGLSLLSCSLDKSAILWRFDPDVGLWIEVVRVGEVGGNTLGFLGCDFGSNEDILLAYNFNGALHLWNKSIEAGGDATWKRGVVPSGHHGAVEDLDWEREGRYFTTVSLDQTTRVHGPWRQDGMEDQWAEMARPQVHGHDLSCVTMLPSHRMASGAEEKLVRVFEATQNFLQNLQNLSKLDLAKDLSEKVSQGASVPSLGLSNKAVDLSENKVQETLEKHVKDQYPDYYFTPELHQQPPPEESLFQNTLWPELQKLYGHGYEIFTLASDKSGHLIASACKAAKTEHAQVLLWDAQTWKLLGKLSGHSLTVIQMEFSPCNNFLLTVSRDRTWALFKRNNDINNGDGQNPFTKIAFTDKLSSVHQRLIWSCS